MHFYSRAAAGERHGSVSEADSDEENEEGDYTVYECPGLAPVSKIFILNKILMELKIIWNITCEITFRDLILLITQELRRESDLMISALGPD
jgi:hypothetical protein